MVEFVQERQVETHKAVSDMYAHFVQRLAELPSQTIESALSQFHDSMHNELCQKVETLTALRNKNAQVEHQLSGFSHLLHQFSSSSMDTLQERHEQLHQAYVEPQALQSVVRWVFER